MWMADMFDFDSKCNTVLSGEVRRNVPKRRCCAIDIAAS